MTRTHSSSSERLLAGMQFTCAPLYQAYRQIWNNPSVGRLVVPFLVLMHQIVRASVPLMRTAQAQSEARMKSDPLGQPLAAYFAEHIEEERDHDEWLLQDLEAAGVTRQDILARAPAPAAAALVGAQYYWILHHHPLAVLGYIRLLEGSPPSPAHVDRLQIASGLPESVFRTYRMHGEVDDGHTRQLDALIDALPLTDRHADLLLQSATHTATALATCLNDLQNGLAPGVR